MSLRKVLSAMNDNDALAAASEGRLAGEGVMDPSRIAGLELSEESNETSMMVLSMINEA